MINPIFGLGLVLVSLLPATADLDADPIEVPQGVECGLGKSFHMGRRAALREAVGDGLMVFRGLIDTRDYLSFHQDKAVWYLTGIESPNITLVMDAGTGEEILFLPKKNRGNESWEGEKWDAGDEWIELVSGFKDVRPTGELLKFLDERITEGDKVWTSLSAHIELAGCFDRANPYDRNVKRDPLDGRSSREDALAEQLTERFGAKVVNCGPQMNELRRVKTSEEIDAMRKAAEIGADALAEAIRSTRPGIGEWDLSALMTWVHLKGRAAGPAYGAIAGCGPNANVLHYMAVTRPLGPAEMVLIDYAPEYKHYTSDITRSWPTDGIFTPRMAELYDVVLESQLAGIAVVKPGATIGDVERACRKVLVDRGFGDLIRHGSCHYIGMEVHDVGDYGKKLVPGVAFTVEPGLYDEVNNIGIRIEDVVVVTEDGCEVISDGVTKVRSELTALVAEKGILDMTE
ncbi:MAG: Xaa-Pro aminopeptidase [Planctomycetota bacterium]|jgi:Xaa-Pro aminopeptidase